MRRREFMALLLGGAAAWPRAARAQQTIPVVGFLSSRSPSESASVVAAFRKGLREMGFSEGNLAIAFRWAQGRYDRLPALASELVDLHVAALFAAGGSPSALAGKQATSTIPVVFVASDPVKLGLVSALNHPGGNVTGISNLTTEITAKSISALRQLTPAATAIALLVNPANPSAKTVAPEAQVATNALGLRLHIVEASTLAELDAAFATLTKLGVKALVVMGEPFFDSQRARLVELSARHAIAGCYPWREYVTAGGLMSYGTNLPDSYRLAGIYVGRLLKGEKAADLPVMQATRFELVLNLGTAKALGLDVPPTLLALADEVIE